MATRSIPVSDVQWTVLLQSAEALLPADWAHFWRRWQRRCAMSRCRSVTARSIGRFASPNGRTGGRRGSPRRYLRTAARLASRCLSETGLEESHHELNINE